MCAHVDIGANCEDVLSAYAHARVYCTRDGRREEAECVIWEEQDGGRVGGHTYGKLCTHLVS